MLDFHVATVSVALRSSSVHQSFESVQVKMLELSSLYARSERFFPKEYLAVTLEKRACDFPWAVSGVYRLMRAMGVAIVDLFKIYDKHFKAKVELRLHMCVCEVEVFLRLDLHMCI